MVTPAAVALDLDGVIRHFDTERLAAIEARHGLEAGVLWAAAFAPERIQPLVTGVITRAEWSRRIGEAVDCPDAAAEWQADIGTVDPEVLTIVDRVRGLGLPVAILTNGTDTVPDELSRLGVLDRVDHLVNSAEVGVAKPDPRIFEHLCAVLDQAPDRVFFADDSAGHVAGARSVGLVAHRFVDAPTLAVALAGLGLDVVTP